jgi:hypothetical protein
MISPSASAPSHLAPMLLMGATTGTGKKSIRQVFAISGV